VTELKVYDQTMQTAVEKCFTTCVETLGWEYEPNGRHSDILNIENAYECFWCLFEDGELIGMIAVRCIDKENNVAEMKRLYILPQHQGKGYGDLLFKHALDYTRMQGYSIVRADTRYDRHSSRHLMEKHGFKPIESYNENEFAELYFELKLPLTRCIMIFPEFSNMHIIEGIRKKYDPLAELVKPHITLVFPFTSELTTQQINEHLHSTLCETQPFEIELKGTSKESGRFGHFIFLNVTGGVDEISKLNKCLYDGLLQEYRGKKVYVPHMTIGRLSNVAEQMEAYEELKNMNATFQTTVKKISVEIIGEQQESIIETEYKL